MSTLVGNVTLTFDTVALVASFKAALLAEGNHTIASEKVAQQQVTIHINETYLTLAQQAAAAAVLLAQQQADEDARLAQLAAEQAAQQVKNDAAALDPAPDLLNMQPAIPPEE